MTDINLASQPLGGEEVVLNIGRANWHCNRLEYEQLEGLAKDRAAL